MRASSLEARVEVLGRSNVALTRCNKGKDMVVEHRLLWLEMSAAGLKSSIDASFRQHRGWRQGEAEERFDLMREWRSKDNCR